MKFIADENIDKPKIIDYLRRRGISIYTLPELKLREARDLEILEFACKYGYAVITRDVRFKNQGNFNIIFELHIKKDRYPNVASIERELKKFLGKSAKTFSKRIEFISC